MRQRKNIHRSPSPSLNDEHATAKAEVAAFNLPIVQALIWVAVFLSYLTGPLSIVWSFTMLWKKETPTILTAWVFVEGLFFIYFLQRLLWFQIPSRWKPLDSEDKRVKLWERILKSTPDVRMWISGWYRTPFENLTKGDLEDFIQLYFNFTDGNGGTFQRGQHNLMEKNHWPEVDRLISLLEVKDPMISKMKQGPARNRASLMSYMCDKCYAYPAALWIYVS